METSDRKHAWLGSGRGRTVAAVVAALLITGGVTASAAKLITGADVKNGSLTGKDIKDGTVQSKDIKDGTVQSKDIKDGTVQSQDVKNGTLKEADLSPAALRALIAYEGQNWSIVDRNVIENGDSYLRAGPGTPPMGIGSLGIRTGGPGDAAAFGNQVDFQGDLVADITTLEYSVYTTQENIDKAPNNLPSIKFEINPNLASTPSTFSTMVFVPDPVAANQWTHIDATTTGMWGLTGAAATATGCDLNGTLCTWDGLQTALDDGGAAATIYSVQFGKGRDFAFSGAVDGLVINNQTFDFEPNGVFTSP